MTISTCVAGLIADGRIKKSQGEKVEKLYDAHYRALKGQMGEMAAADLASERAIKQAQAELNRSKLLAAKTIETQTGLLQQMKGFNGGKTGERIDPRAAQAVLSADERADYSHRSYLEGRYRAIQATADGQLREIMAAHHPDLLGRVRDPAALDAIGREAYGEHSGNPTAKAGAKAWLDTADDLRRRINAAGGDIGHAEDWGLPQFSDARRVNAAGFEKWRDTLMAGRGGEPLLDLGKMIDRDTGMAFTRDKLDQVLRESTFEGIRTEGWDDRTPGAGGSGGGSLANRGTDPRFLKFRDYAAWKQYNDAFGEGSLYNAMTGLVEHRSRTAAALEILGPNPEHTIGWLRDTVTKSAEMDSGAGSKAVIEAGKGNTVLDHMWDGWTGKSNRAADPRIAAFFDSWKALQTSAKLGSAIVSQLSDFGLQANARRFAGLPVTSMLGDYLRFMKPGSTEDRLFMARMGIGLEEWRNAAAAQHRFMLEDFARPLTRQLAESVLALQGSHRWMQAGRSAWGYAFWNTITHQRGLDWGGLDAGFRNVLGHSGFDQASWDALRSTATAVYKGQQWVMPENIADPAIRDRTLAMIHRQADTVLPLQNLRTRAALQSALPQRGTIPGELVRSTLMFKGFGLSIAMAQGQRMAQMSAGKAARYAVGFVISMTVLGAAEVQIKNMLNGRDPEPMTSPEFWGEAMLQGGGLGIAGDFLKDAVSRTGGDLKDFIAGPMWEDMSNYSKIISAKKGHRGAAALRAIKPDIPGSSLWYARLAFSRMVTDQLQQEIDPNYAHSWQRLHSHARQMGTDYWWGPGQTSPARAPDMDNAIQEPPPADQ